MTNIFVFTASDPNSHKHVQDTIERPIPAEKVEKHFQGQELEQVKSLGLKHGYYAWGALPGTGNIETWKRMAEGDYVIAYQNKHYTYYSRVLYKTVNEDFGKENWGMSEEGDHTWDHIYFLEKPYKLDPPLPAADLAAFLPASYRGFMRLADKRVSELQANFGGISEFFEEAFVKRRPMPERSASFWWVNQGDSYTDELGKKFIWATLEGKEGVKPRHWATIKSVNKGDFIFNYASGALRGLSIASDKGRDFYNESSTSPDKNGTRVDIEHHSIDPIPMPRIKARAAELLRLLEGKMGPFEKEGDIKQGYLYEFTLDAGRIIREIYGKPFPDPFEAMFAQKPEYRIILALRKKQIILYGPPGTGKTYQTKQIAIDLLKSGS